MAAQQKKIGYLKVLFVSAVVFVIGIACILTGELLIDRDSWWRVLFVNVGTIACTSAVVSLIWEWFLKQQAVTQMYATAKLSDRVRESGLMDISTDFQKALNWSQEIGGAAEIDAFFAYSDRWRRNHTAALRAAASKKLKFRLILPDFRDDSVVNALAVRYRREAENHEQATSRIRSTIVDNIHEFYQLVQKSPNAKGKLSLYLIREVPSLTLYRLDNVAVILGYNQSGEPGKITCITAREGGFLYEFAKSELQAMTKPTFDASEKVEDVESLLSEDQKSETLQSEHPQVNFEIENKDE